jgi:hypothetical protein
MEVRLDDMDRRSEKRNFTGVQISLGILGEQRNDTRCGFPAQGDAIIGSRLKSHPRRLNGQCQNDQASFTIGERNGNI